ncbi:glycoside hydrolase family 30 protein [Mucilaginibacter gynuensis]|uniref:Glycoside hydrolase family 30 protein n=1 Tax=Mucilaginibacter gynuensis TaxID=1302236 RepID=A0ABP8G9I3_9SPHI
MSNRLKFLARALATVGIAQLLTANAGAQTMEWVTSSATENWKVQHKIPTGKAGKTADATITNQKLQVIDGWGGCFNELGWTSLNVLPAADQQAIFKELFSPGAGANFNICRMPIGANDFARKWYSYDETDGDFGLTNFSIANDEETLIPFIKSALKQNPKLKLWASPWSPPVWMKVNKQYAGAPFPKTGVKAWQDLRFDFDSLDNGVKPGQEGKEGTNMFIQDEQHFKSYANYFAEFIKAYRKQNINIGMVMPQNEFNSPQTFPSCTWTADGLSKFVSYLGPEMNKLGVNIFMGTVERGNPKLADTVISSAASGKYIKGAGFQWAGKDAIATIHQKYPALKLYQSEQECGNGLNDWKYCTYTWSLMKHYLSNGANAYMYWNISLQNGGKSTWGWFQNSLITVDTTAKTYKYNYEYYLMKHFSHYIQPGAYRLQTDGSFGNLLAFQNPDKSMVIVAYNEGTAAKKISINAGGKTWEPELAPDSFHTFYIKN